MRIPGEARYARWEAVLAERHAREAPEEGPEAARLGGRARAAGAAGGTIGLVGLCCIAWVSAAPGPLAWAITIVTWSCSVALLARSVFYIIKAFAAIGEYKLHGGDGMGDGLGRGQPPQRSNGTPEE